MQKRTHKLEFPEAPGNYWYLYWIGKIIYEKSMKIEFYFVNTNAANDHLKYFNLSNVHIHKMPVAYLVEFKIGTLYSVPDRNIIDYELTKSGLIPALSVRDGYKPTSKKFPLIGNQFFPKIKDSLDSELTYMNFYYYGMPVLVTPYCLAQYLFFKSNKLIHFILSGSLLDHFHFNKIRFFRDQTHNRVIAELPFDQGSLGNDDAKVIAPYLFMKGDIGIRMMRSLYSNLNASFIQARHNKKKLESYLKLDFRLRGYKLGLEGKHFYDNKTDLKNKEGKILLTYDIKYLQFNDPDIFSVDQIYLIPYNSKQSTKDKKNHDEKEVTRPTEPDTRTISLILHNNLPGRSALSNEATINDNSRNPFNVAVDLINREEQDQAYKVVPIPSNEDLDGLVRGLEEYCKDSKFIQESIRKEMIFQDSINKFQYFYEVINTLNNRFQVSINEDPLGIGLNYYPTEIKCDNHFLYVGLVEANYKSAYSYIIEFGKGFIGFFQKRDSRRISHNELKLLINKFIQADKGLGKNKVLWSLIYEESNYYLKNYSIIIHRGIEHTLTERLDSNEEQSWTNKFYDTAKRIYDRIIKTIP